MQVESMTVILAPFWVEFWQQLLGCGIVSIFAIYDPLRINLAPRNPRVCPFGPSQYIFIPCHVNWIFVGGGGGVIRHLEILVLVECSFQIPYSQTLSSIGLYN